MGLGAAGTAVAGGIASAGTSAALGGLLGGAGGSQGQQSSSQQQSGAPSWQVPYQQSTIQDAQNLYNQQQNDGPPTNFDWVAPMNWQQQNGITQQYNVGNSAASNYAPWNNVGQTLANNAAQYQNVAESVSQNGIGSMYDPNIEAALSNYALTGTLNGAPSVNGNLASVATQAGTQGLTALNSAQSAANNALQANAGGVQSAQNATQGAANNQSQGALNATQNYGQTQAQGALNASQNTANSQAMGATNASINGANALVNSSATQNAINAADLSVNRNLTENTLPQIQAQAAASGNTNSSREGALEGVATSQAQQNMLANAAQIEDNAFNTGAATGANSYNAGAATGSSNYNTGSALGSNNYNTGAQLGAAQYQNAIGNNLNAATALNSTGNIAGNLTTGEQGLQQQNQQATTGLMLNAANSTENNALNYQNADYNAILNANAQLGNGLTIGQNATNTAMNGNLAGAQAEYNAGTNYQTQAQGQINNQLAQYQATQQYPWQLLNSMGAFTQPNTGTQTTFQGQQGGGLSGALSGLLGGASTGYSLYNKLAGSGQTADGTSSTGGFDAVSNTTAGYNGGWGGYNGYTGFAGM